MQIDVTCPFATFLNLEIIFIEDLFLSYTFRYNYSFILAHFLFLFLALFSQTDFIKCFTTDIIPSTFQLKLTILINN